jgi:UDP-glucuronate decarboxylase
MHPLGYNKSMNKKISGVLITGGSGFIGSHLAEFYLSQNIPVMAVDNLCTGYPSNALYLEKKYNKSLFQFIKADVVEQWQWKQQLKFKAQYIYHLASPASPPLYQELALETMWVNSKGLENALTYADEQNARLIYASTSEVYGDPHISPQPESYWGNVNSFGLRSCYDESKRFGEALIYTWNWKKKTKHGLVRIFNTYGSRMNPTDGRVVINFLVQALRNEDLTVYGNGEQTRSFCYVDDLIDGLTKYAETDLTVPVNLGNDTEFSVLELAQIVQEIFKQKNLKIVFQGLPTDDPKQRKPDLTLAKKTLNSWSPKTSLREGLQKTLDWVKAEQQK